MSPTFKLIDKKPNECLVCGSTNISTFVYGYPSYEDADLAKKINDGTVILGGCASFVDMPDWVCQGCNCKYRQELNLVSFN